jgi:hypothetical protein
MENTYVKDWVLKVGTPMWERACVAQAASMTVSIARKKLQRWKQQADTRTKRVPFCLLYASGTCESKYLQDADCQEEDPDAEEPFYTLLDTPWSQGRGGRFLDWVEQGRQSELPIWPQIAQPWVEGQPPWPKPHPCIAKMPAEMSEDKSETALEEPSSKRRKLLGDFKMVKDVGEATPRGPAWEKLYKGLGKQKFHKELASEGLVSHKSVGQLYWKDQCTQKYVQLP